MNIKPEIIDSELNYLIPPEIKNDEFYAVIQKICREEDIETVLEIGSSSGGGSTGSRGGSKGVRRREVAGAAEAKALVLYLTQGCRAGIERTSRLISSA